MDEVFYRLPETSQYHHVWGEAEKLHDIANLAGKRGFVFAPFETTDDHPLVLIHADHEEVREVGEAAVETAVNKLSETDHHAEYEEAFAKLRAQIDDEILWKVVLARRSDVELEQPIDAHKVFSRLARCIPIR